MSCIVHLTLQPINVADLITELIGWLCSDVATGTWVFFLIEIVELISTLHLASRLTFATSLCRKE